MTNVRRNTILSCQYKTLSANKLVDGKVHFYLLLRNKKYAKKGTRKFVQLGETTKNWMQQKLILLQYSVYHSQNSVILPA